MPHINFFYYPKFIFNIALIKIKIKKKTKFKEKKNLIPILKVKMFN